MITGAQTLEPSCTVLARLFPGSWIGRGAAKTETTSCKGRRHQRRWRYSPHLMPAFMTTDYNYKQKENVDILTALEGEDVAYQLKLPLGMPTSCISFCSAYDPTSC